MASQLQRASTRLRKTHDARAFADTRCCTLRTAAALFVAVPTPIDNMTSPYCGSHPHAPLPTLCSSSAAAAQRVAARTSPCPAHLSLPAETMVFLARPRRAAEASAPPPPPTHLRGGFDAGFCVRGEARDNASGPAAASPAAVQAARRAPAFASLSRALFQLSAAPAPTKCVASPAAPCDSATLPARSPQRAERAAPDCCQARRGAGAALQRGQGPR